MRSGRAARLLAVSAVGVLAVVVAALAIAAYDRAHPDAPSGAMAPAPTFTLGVATPTPIPTAPTIPPDRQRLLAIGSTQWWRATAGACGGGAPVIERSSDGGVTWSGVTPNYLGIERVLTLDAFTSADAEVVAGVAGCNAQALRTYTRGQFWESYPEVLAASRFVDPKNSASVHLPTGLVPAPCDSASGLHAEADVVVLLCDGRAWSWTGSAWDDLSPEDALAVAIDGPNVVVAHTRADCAGVAISRVALASPDAATTVGCAEGTDAAQPVAIDFAGSAVVVWVGDAVVTIG